MKLDYIKATKFFPAYASKVKDWKHKLSGKNGRGNPVEFSLSDQKEIKAGLKKLFSELA